MTTTTLLSYQTIILALIPKFSSLVSMAASLWIILEVLFEKDKRQLVYHRLLTAFAIVDVISSSWTFASSWPMPRGTENTYAAVGNTATCTAQGFFLQLGLMLPIYTTMLSIYYMLVIRYAVSEEKLRTKWERWMHLVPFTMAFGTAFASLPLEIFNEADLWCWIATHPEGCVETVQDGYTTCIRGYNASIYRWAFYYVPLWTCFAVILYCMVTVYQGVQFQERRIAKYVHNVTRVAGDMNTNGRSPRATVKRWFRTRLSFTDEGPRTQQVASQAMWYVAAFYFSYSFGTMLRVWQHVGGGISPFPVLLLYGIMQPLQGFWNVIVYRRPTYLRIRKYNPELSGIQAARQAMKWSFLDPVGASNMRRRRSTYASGGRMPERRKTNQTSDETLGEMPQLCLSDRLSQIVNSERIDESLKHIAILAEMEVIEDVEGLELQPENAVQS